MHNGRLIIQITKVTTVNLCYSEDANRCTAEQQECVLPTHCRLVWLDALTRTSRLRVKVVKRFKTFDIHSNNNHRELAQVFYEVPTTIVSIYAHAIPWVGRFTKQMSLKLLHSKLGPMFSNWMLLLQKPLVTGKCFKNISTINHY